MSESVLLADERIANEAVLDESTVETAPVSDPPEREASEVSLDQRAALLSAVQNARDLPPGVRDRLQGLVQQAVTLDVTGEPLLATRQVLDLLAQGLPPVLRRETSAPVQRPAHPVGDAFFALPGEDLTDQQAEQIAQQQLQRAGLLRTA